MLERRRDAVRVDKVLDVEHLVAGDVLLVSDLLLDEEHLADVGDLDGLAADAGQPLRFEQGGQVDEFCAVRFVVEVEHGPPRVFKLEPDVGGDVSLVDLFPEFRRDRGRDAEDKVFLDGERFVRVRVEFAVPAYRVGRVDGLTALAAVPLTHPDAESVPATASAVLVV